MAPASMASIVTRLSWSSFFSLSKMVRQGGNMGVSENKGVPYIGVLIIRILLYLGYYMTVPYFRKPAYVSSYGCSLNPTPPKP